MFKRKHQTDKELETDGWQDVCDWHTAYSQQDKTGGACHRLQSICGKAMVDFNWTKNKVNKKYILNKSIVVLFEIVCKYTFDTQ